MTAQTYVIRQFDIMSVAKFCAVLGILWGFIMGLFVAAGVGAMGSMMGTFGLGFLGGVAALIFMMIFGAVAGFIWGAIVALVYNLVAGGCGGVEMELEIKQ